MITNASGERTFCIRLGMYSIAEEQTRTLFQWWFKAKNEMLKVDKKVSHFTLQCFLWASVGFEMNHWINFHKQRNTLHDFSGFPTHNGRCRAMTVRVRHARVGWVRGMDAGLKSAD